MITRSPDTRRPIILMDLGEMWWWNKEVDDVITAKRKLSKHGRLANAHEHHLTLPGASPDAGESCTPRGRQGGL